MPKMFEIGFIDDTPAELPMIQNLCAGMTDVRITGALTLEDLQEQFRRLEVQPGLIALDVSYVKDEDPDEERVKELLASPPTMLPLTGERAEVLRNSYANSALASQYFADLQDATANHTRGGIRLARAVRTAFASVPIVGYSRKTSVTGAIVYRATTEACAFVQKPNDPFSWEKTAELTRKMGGQIISEWRKIAGLSEFQQEILRQRSQDAARFIISHPGLLRDQAIREGLEDFLPELAPWAT